jgi:hypothetical protein
MAQMRSILQRVFHKLELLKKSSDFEFVVFLP